MSGLPIAHHRIVSTLGEGAIGTVYRATDTKLNRDVAIEMLREASAGDRGRVVRFEHEAQVLASLNHPILRPAPGVEGGAEDEFLRKVPILEAPGMIRSRSEARFTRSRPPSAPRTFQLGARLRYRTKRPSSGFAISVSRG